MTEPRIFQINASKGGVPKFPLYSATIGELGITTDRHADMRHHGGPDRALCIYSIEQILALQGEGHPIFPGAIGENIVTRGIDLSVLEPGNRMRLGDDVEIEITDYAPPCRTIRAAFRDEDFQRASQKTNPGWSRLYTRILTQGIISVGDAITIL
ncbi:MAG: MOSC domain-containing protein [Candidatus Kapaibacterium sp.]